MYRTRSPFDLLHGTPAGLAVLPAYETAVDRVAALKKAALLAVLRSRRCTSRSQRTNPTGGSKHG